MADTQTQGTQGDQAALLENWHEEIQAATIYRRLADKEPDENRKRVLAELSATEDRHAQRWARRLEELGVTVPDRKTVRLPRSLDLSLRFAPVDAVIAHQEAEERRLSSSHSEMTGDTDTDALLQEISAEDSEHAAALRGLLPGTGAGRQTKPNVQSALDRILRRETWNRQDNSWIGGAIYGVNDGLAAVFGIVAGTSAATGGGHLVLIAGLAGAIASAVSMGSGAFLATRSEQEVYDAQIFRESGRSTRRPEEERRAREALLPAQRAVRGRSRSSSPTASPRTLTHCGRHLAQEARLPAPSPARTSTRRPRPVASGAAIHRCRRDRPVIPFFFATGRPRSSPRRSYRS